MSQYGHKNGTAGAKIGGGHTKKPKKGGIKKIRRGVVGNTPRTRNFTSGYISPDEGGGFSDGGYSYFSGIFDRGDQKFLFGGMVGGGIIFACSATCYVKYCKINDL